MFRTALHPTTFTAITTVMLLAGASHASAQVGQPWIERGYFNLNVGFETSSGTLTDAATFSIYDESGSKTVEQSVDSGALFDFSVGARVWRNVSVGVGYHRGTSTGDASVTAAVPSPVVFNANRAAAATVGDLERSVGAFYLQVGYMILLSDDLSVHVTGGPSFFNVSQDVVADLTYTDSPPYTTVIATPVIQERSDSATGINIGADVTYRFWESDAYKIGGGMFLRYSAATARIRVLENEVDSDLGGLQIGFGARVRF